jgi:hypothetical protein
MVEPKVWLRPLDNGIAEKSFGMFAHIGVLEWLGISFPEDTVHVGHQLLVLVRGNIGGGCYSAVG